MYETETRVQTRTRNEDMFANYQPISPTRERIMAPEFKPFSFGSEAPTQNETQEPAFEVQKQYSFDTNSYVQEQEIVASMEMPTLQRHEEQQIVARSEQQIVARPKLNARGKIVVAVYSIVVAIIVAFCIYNAVAIRGLQGDVASKEQIVASQTQVITELQNTYNELGGDDYIASQVGDTFKTPTDADIVKVNGFEMVERPTEVSQNNWFESFCQSLRKLFS